VFPKETLKQNTAENLTQMDTLCRRAVRERLFLVFPVKVFGKRHPDQLTIRKGPHKTTTTTHHGVKQTRPDGNHLTILAEVGTRAATCHLYLTPNDGQISGKHGMLNLTYTMEPN
jgi:hypothetical protein